MYLAEGGREGPAQGRERRSAIREARGGDPSRAAGADRLQQNPNPCATKSKPGATESKSRATESKSGATKTKLHFLPRFSIFQWVGLDSGDD
jgi:hypothetical protein